jgi:hypothetical protein
VVFPTLGALFSWPSVLCSTLNSSRYGGIGPPISPLYPDKGEHCWHDPDMFERHQQYNTVLCMPTTSFTTNVYVFSLAVNVFKLNLSRQREVKSSEFCYIRVSARVHVSAPYLLTFCMLTLTLTISKLQACSPPLSSSLQARQSVNHPHCSMLPHVLLARYDHPSPMNRCGFMISGWFIIYSNPTL